MNDRSITAITLSIAAVERDTGLSKDTLRVWERRYGFPMPSRDGLGERSYSIAEVEKLRIVKRLLDAGHRPGRIVPLAMEHLQALADQTVDQPLRGADEALGSADLRAQLELLRRHDAPALRSALMRLLQRMGAVRFITEVVAPLNATIGDAWIRGQIEVFEEHLYTETVQNLLRVVLSNVPAAAVEARPRVLLTTFPGEQHALGILMAEVLLALEGCACVSLGLQTPLWDIARAASAFRCDIVALGFTGVMNPNHVHDGLAELRSKLPGPVAIWAGGSAPVLGRRRIEGVEPFDSVLAIAPAVRAWRAHAATVPDSAGA